MAFLDTLKSTGEVVGVFAGIGVTLWKTFLQKWVRSMRERRKKEKDHIIDELRSIKNKLFPNGGSSIDDKLEMSLQDNKEIKKSLVELRAGQRNTWEIMDIPVWKSNDQGRTVYVNKPYCELVGCTYPDAVGMAWLGLIADFDRSKVREAWKESIENVSDFDMCYSFRRPDGMYQKVNGIAIHNKDGDGKLQSSMGRLIKVGEPYKL